MENNNDNEEKGCPFYRFPYCDFVSVNTRCFFQDNCGNEKHIECTLFKKISDLKKKVVPEKVFDFIKRIELYYHVDLSNVFNKIHLTDDKHEIHIGTDGKGMLDQIFEQLKKIMND